MANPIRENGVYCVTGAAGFIGSHIAEALLARGARVRALDDFSSGQRARFEWLASKFGGRFEPLEGDVANAADCERAFKGAEVVWHEAARPSVQRSMEDPEGTNRANVTGTLTVLHTARALGVRRVVFAASSSAYGDQPTLPKVETMSPDPRSPYAASKLCGEMYCMAFTHGFGLETVCLRYFNVFGPRQDPNSHYAAVVPRFASRLLRGEAPTVYGDGLQSRDFTYIDNVVHANLRAAEAAAEKASGGVFNVGTATHYNLLELIDRLKVLTGATQVKPVFEAARVGDVKHSLADITAARNALGYDPKIDFDEGLKRTVASLKAGA